MRNFLRSVSVCLLAFAAIVPAQAYAQGVASAISRLLEQESLPPERLPAIFKMASQRGDEQVLETVLNRAVGGDWSDELKVAALEALSDASTTRDLKPANGREQLTTLFDDSAGASVREAAIRLAGEWADPNFAAALTAIARNDKASVASRVAAIRAIAKLGDDGHPTVIELAQSDSQQAIRVASIRAWAGFDVTSAAKSASKMIESVGRDAGAFTLVQVFLERDNGSAQLAKAIEQGKIAPERAKFILQSLYSIGRNDPELTTALAKAAGIAMTDKPLTPEDIEAIAANAVKKGDPALGELVFRRADLSCLNCHMVSGAGGNIGPDLSAIGPSNPTAFLVTSIVDPDAAIKEHYATQSVVTDEGIVVTGLVVRANESTITLRTAEGIDHNIAKSSIIDQQSGGSLMPKGLVKFMTEDELMHLIRFLSDVGRPGTPYALRSRPTIQRWRQLVEPPESFQSGIPGQVEFNKDLPPLGAGNWKAFYARVNGEIPMVDLTGGPTYLLSEIEVTEGGAVGLRMSKTQGIDLWINGDHIDGLTQELVTELPPGKQTLVLRIDPAAVPNKPVSVEVFQPENSSALAKPVDGT